MREGTHPQQVITLATDNMKAVGDSIRQLEIPEGCQQPLYPLLKALRLPWIPGATFTPSLLRCHLRRDISSHGNVCKIGPT